MSLGGYPGGLNSNSFQSFASTSGFGKQLVGKVIQPSPAFKTKMLGLLRAKASVNNVVCLCESSLPALPNVWCD